MKSTLQAGLRYSAKVEVAGRDGVDEICRPTHNRFVVEVAASEKRLAAKAGEAGLA